MIKLANRPIQPLCHLSADGSTEANRPRVLRISSNHVRDRGSSSANIYLRLKYLAFFCVKESGSVVCEGPALAGREFFPFECFEHRIVRAGGTSSSSEEVAKPGGLPVLVSSLL
jgi:hypothetical protein